MLPTWYNRPAVAVVGTTGQLCTQVPTVGLQGLQQLTCGAANKEDCDKISSCQWLAPNNTELSQIDKLEPTMQEALAAFAPETSRTSGIDAAPDMIKQPSSGSIQRASNGNSLPRDPVCLPKTVSYIEFVNSVSDNLFEEPAKSLTAMVCVVSYHTLHMACEARTLHIPYLTSYHTLHIPYHTIHMACEARINRVTKLNVTIKPCGKHAASKVCGYAPPTSPKRWSSNQSSSHTECT